MVNNMTALISCFARAYHFRNNQEWVFKDDIAEKLLSEEEYKNISSNMSSGISFFNPNFHGTKETALSFIVNNHLAPSVLARSTFCERSLSNAIRFGCSQYVLFGSGYDSFSVRCKFDGLKIYELDRPDMIVDKRSRLSVQHLRCHYPTFYLPCDLSDDSWMQKLKEIGFSSDGLSFGSLLGLSYYFTKSDFENLLKKISLLWGKGSTIVFDYPVYGEGDECKKNNALAKEACEEMQSKYSYAEIEKLLESCGFLIYEHLNDKEMTNAYFSLYNNSNPNNCMRAPLGVNYCLAIKK